MQLLAKALVQWYQFFGVNIGRWISAGTTKGTQRITFELKLGWWMLKDLLKKHNSTKIMTL